MNLYEKYRPQKLSEIAGNEEQIESLEKSIKKEGVPQVNLFHGPTGCGKTTIARILAQNILKAGRNISELDSAQFNGIETIRQIRRESRLKPIGSKNKCYIIDECFHEDTKILLADGSQKKIRNIRKGDFVANLVGIGQVTDVFVNTIPLERLVKVQLSNGEVIYCSDSHEFMTTTGWTCAKDLQNNFVFLNKSSNFVQNINLQIDDKSREKLRRVWEEVDSKTEEVLQSPMLEQIQRKKTGTSIGDHLQNMWLSIRGNGEKQKSIDVQQNLRRQIRSTTTNGENSKGIYQEKDFRKTDCFSSNQKRQASSEEISKTHDQKEPNAKKEEYQKNDANKSGKWNFARICWYKGRKREPDNTSKTFSGTIGMENRSGNHDQCQKGQQIPLHVQSRHREEKEETSNRDRWQGSQHEKAQTIRLEERKEVERVRVDCVTFYKRGDNEESFEGIIKDKEKAQKYIDLYDFEVSEHHSYYANNVLVHNCHNLTRQAQEAFLKELETTPKNVYYFLCTTNPEKLIAPLKGRCKIYQLDTLDTNDMLVLLKSIIKKEKEDVDKKVIKAIITSAAGHPRNALNILQQVLPVSPKKRLKAAQRIETAKIDSIELCRSMIQGKGWKDTQTILNGLKQENAEGVRQHVLKYCQSVLLGNDFKGTGHRQAAAILNEFEENTFDMGFARIVLACYAFYHAE